jgi:DNA polymerase III gamma/tau subunit
MRDAESMLDQVISSGVDKIDADTVRDLLGLAEMESVERFIAALAGGDALDGIRLLDELERDGRDLVAFADQVVARLREQLVSALTEGPRSADSGTRLTRAARRLAGLDVNRGAAGGYRLQLELALLEGTDSNAPSQPIGAKAPTARSEPAPPKSEPPPPKSEAPAAKSDVPVRSVEPVKSEVPAAKSEAPAAKSEPQPVSSDDPLAVLLASWPTIVERISRNPANRPLINACRPVEVRGATIVLGFPESQAFLRDIAQRKQHLLEEGIAEVLGRAVAVTCVATNIELPHSNGSDDLVAQARKIFEDDLADVAEVD